MRLRRNVALSLRALFVHRLRAVLALSSVSIGVAAVMLTSAIGTGAQRSVQHSIEGVGANLLVIRPAQVVRFAGRKEIKGNVTTLQLDDYRDIVTLPVVADAAAGVEGPVRVKHDRTTTLTTLRGTTPAYLSIRRFQVASGRFFDDEDDLEARRVAVLGARVARSLFDDEDPLGGEIRVRGVPFDVIGVLASKGGVADGDDDNQILVPVRTAARRVFNTTWLNAVFVSVRAPDLTDVAEREIGAALSRRHRPGRDGQRDFEVQNAARFFTMQKKTADSLTTLSAGIAGISLVVGGIGIMGLMLLSVKERTGEIGLRMAVGATPRDILIQFLLEASVLSLGGWTIGLMLGAIGAFVVRSATAWQVGAPMPAVVASFGMAVVIGLGFGSVPARKASTIPPVQALVAR